MQATHKNVTSAIRAAVQPYVIYRNQSDPHFPGATGRLDDGRSFVVDGPFTSGLDHVAQKVRAAWTEPNADAVYVAVENTLHDLSGTFDLRVLQQPGTTGTGGHDDNSSAANDTATVEGPVAMATVVDFAVDRVRLSVTYDALRPNCYCTAVVQMYGATASPRRRDGVVDAADESLQRPVRQAAAAFFGAVKDHLSVGTCAAIAKTNERTRPRHYHFCR